MNVSSVNGCTFLTGNNSFEHLKVASEAVHIYIINIF